MNPNISITLYEIQKRDGFFPMKKNLKILDKVLELFWMEKPRANISKTTVKSLY